MRTVRTRDLIELATASVDRLGAGEGLPDPVVLELPENLPISRGRTVNWEPLVALAVAGHICQHWGEGAGARGPFEVEDGHSVAEWATLLSPGDGHLPSRRLQAGGSQWGERGIWVVELCGHCGCKEHAPAGPGSRCPDHFTDLDPYGKQGPYWAELAARAWGERYGADGREHPQRVAERRAWLVRQAVAAGMPEEDVAAEIGAGQATVEEILRPAPRPQWDGDYDIEPV